MAGGSCIAGDAYPVNTLAPFGFHAITVVSFVILISLLNLFMSFERR